MVAVHPTKAPMFTPEERVRLLRESLGDLGNVSFAFDRGLTVEFARAHDAGVLVRGVRDASDAAYETELAQLNRDLAPDVTTVFVPADRALAGVSSSMLKQMASEGVDLAAVCHPAVARALLDRAAATGLRRPASA